MLKEPEPRSEITFGKSPMPNKSKKVSVASCTNLWGFICFIPTNDWKSAALATLQIAFNSNLPEETNEL